MTESKNRKAERIIRELKEFVRAIRVNWWLIAGHLRIIKQEGLWQGRAETWESFLLDYVDVSERTGQRLIRAYEMGVLELKKKPEELPPYTKFDEVAELVEAAKTSREKEIIIATAELPRRELRKWKREKKFGIEIAKCQHEWQKIVFYKCKKCKDTKQ